MYETMLVPLDGSEVAEVVLPYAAETAASLGMRVLLLHVYSPGANEVLPMRTAYLQRVAEKVRGEIAQIEVGSGVEPSSGAVTTRLVEGRPAETILETAEHAKVDFILMATHGRSGIGRWAMGSVADRVLRAANVPVWLVRAGTPEEMLQDDLSTRTIIVPLDGSDLGEAVLPHVVTLAKQGGGELPAVVLLRVTEQPSVQHDSGATSTTNWELHLDRLQAVERQDAVAYLSKVAKPLEEAGLSVQTLVLKGEPASKIVAYASKNLHCLIAMSTHGRGGVGRWICGSVTERVLHAAECPVFVVRPQR